MATTGSFPNHRNAQFRNANAGATLKRGFNDNRGYGGGIRDYQEERNRYAPPQKRFRSQPQPQPQPQFRSEKIPLYHHPHGSSNNNMSRVSSQSYNNYGVDVIASNSSFPLRNNVSNTNNYQKPFVGFGNNPNPQIVPVPLPYRKLNDDVALDSLPEWVPNHQPVSRTLTPNYPVPSTNFVPNTSVQAPVFTNYSNMASVVSQSMPQPIVFSKELIALLSVLNNEKEKPTSEASKPGELPLGLSFDNPSSLNVRHESVIKSLYSDMPRQCSSCGVRFKCQEEHSKHMDWHVRKNRTAKPVGRQGQQTKKSRGWLASASLWLSAATGGGMEQAAKPSFGGETQKKEEEQKQLVVPADENQKNCALCEEPFEEFFSHEDDDWMYKDAVYLNKKGRIVHAKCMPETRKDSRELPISVPSVAVQ
ncbi:PREDICTED: polyadenylation and cleavage factor homolog 1-like [Camelina sativa]|uniref:Polyadenylation and cleavage factor homolog 1-like n=1 Tax=Camelina sativa TaxID=90675 RepID=A0ABM0Z7F4_CAMSA|nr:PREDICTED: polyadenylation and cleavage factor homolog 1-like [Camelina sativa]